MSPQRRSLLRWMALGSLLPAAGFARSAALDVRAIVGASDEQEREVERELRVRYPQMRTTLGAALRTVPRADCFVAIGPEAAQTASGASLPAPLISIRCSRQSFARSFGMDPERRRVTAIHAEASPDHQMRLISAVFGRSVTVGALVSPESAFMAPLLSAAAGQHGQELVLVEADLAVSLSRNLSRLGSATSVLIFPDRALYTRASLRELLETTYRRRQPVFGFSDALVGAGMLASAYASVDDTLAQLSGVIPAVVGGAVPAPQYPRYWQVAVNDNVARSFDIVVGSEARRMGDRP